MIKSACNRMKSAFLSSLALTALGGFSVLVPPFFGLEGAPAVFFSYLGFFAIFGGALVLAITGLLILLPRVSRQLDLCRH